LIERATGNLDAVEAHLLRLAPATYVRGEMPSVTAYVCRYLKKDDPRRIRVEQLAQEAEARELLSAEREAVIAAYHAASSQRRRELMRVRSFRNVLAVASVVLLLVVIGLGVLGSLRPEAIPLCFEPETQEGVSLVCPTGEERIRRGEDIDDKIAATVSGWPRSSPETAVFGYAQQLVTRLVDQQAHAVLEDVGGRGASGDRPTSADATSYSLLAEGYGVRSFRGFAG
jgi:hypothetical protein